LLSGDDKGMVEFLPKTVNVKGIEIPNKLKFVNYQKMQVEHFFRNSRYRIGY